MPVFGLICLFLGFNFWSSTMDNLVFTIKGAVIDAPKLKATLIGMGINVSTKTLAKQGKEVMTFSMPIGPHGARWLFRINPAEGTISCSGGVTKTFFGHNVWVFNNEATQMVAIMGIVCDALARLAGLSLPSDSSAYKNERVELTAHYVLPDEIPVKQALDALDLHFMTLFPNSYSPPEGKTHDKLGVVRLGKTKSTRSCRAYDPAAKFGNRPDHVPEASWDLLKSSCERHLRVEIIFNKRELEVAGLNMAADWNDKAKVAKLISDRYNKLGLSVQFQAGKDHFKPAEVRASNPSYVEYLRHWFSDGKNGTAPNKRNGSFNRFKQFMTEKGYRYEVSFARHEYLIHGLHEVLVPERAAVVPDEVRKAPNLFHKWWITGQ
jgi:hypothetical protein